MQTKTIRLFYYLTLSLVSLFLLRLSLYFIYFDDFTPLTFNETMISFIVGTQIDLISTLTFSGIVVLLMFLPFKFTITKIYQNILGYFWYLILLVIVFIIIADIVYFQFVHRHMSNEIMAIGNDTQILFDMLLEYINLFIAFFIYATIIFFIFKKILKSELQESKKSFIHQLLILLAVISILFLSVRGKVFDKPFGISDAFTSDKVSSGNLALNGFYTLYRTISKKQKIYKFYETDKALVNSKQLLNSNKFEFTDTNYPLMRANKDIKQNKHNVIIVLLESWSSKYVDSFGNNNLGVTPNFDKIAKEGLIFDNFYSNGQRSIDAIGALFTGVPTIKGFNFLGKGLELSNLSYIASLAKDNNYTTLAMQTSKRSSFHMDTITKLAGFNDYYSEEDMPHIGDEDKNKKPRFGTWDGNMYQLLSKKLSKAKEPFLSFSFTSTTHAPFISPGKQWEQYNHNTKNIFGFLNTLKYADDKLGQFMQRCKKESWFDNTIFIFMADHTIGFGNDSKLFEGTSISIKNRPLENMRIPLVIYAPKIFKPKTISTIGSQASIIPTLIDILGWHGNFSTLSNSLFSQSNNDFVLFTRGQSMGLVDNSGYINHTLDKKLETTGDENIEKKLLSIVQTTSQLLRQNKLVKAK